MQHIGHLDAFEVPPDGLDLLKHDSQGGFQLLDLQIILVLVMRLHPRQLPPHWAAMPLEAARQLHAQRQQAPAHAKDR